MPGIYEVRFAARTACRCYTTQTRRTSSRQAARREERPGPHRRAPAQVQRDQHGDFRMTSQSKCSGATARRTLVIFSDPYCPACKQFEKVPPRSRHHHPLLQYPVIRPELAEHSRAVWCAPDRSKAWLDLALRGKPVVGATKCMPDRASHRPRRQARRALYADSVLAPASACAGERLRAQLRYCSTKLPFRIRRNSDGGLFLPGQRLVARPQHPIAPAGACDLPEFPRHRRSPEKICSHGAANRAPVSCAMTSAEGFVERGRVVAEKPVRRAVRSADRRQSSSRGQRNA